jgi:hypothetical protein
MQTCMRVGMFQLQFIYILLSQGQKKQSHNDTGTVYGIT